MLKILEFLKIFLKISLPIMILLLFMLIWLTSIVSISNSLERCANAVENEEYKTMTTCLFSNKVKK